MFDAIAGWLEATLIPYGGLGLFVLAVCDSSFLSLPEVNDLLLMYFSIESPERMPLFAGCTTAGSLVGCLMLYSVGKRGGESFLRRKMSGERLDRFRHAYQRYGILAVLVPSLLPPPAPFKIFVLSAGAFGVSTWRFTVAALIGRGTRYFVQGILAVLYGEVAITYVRENAAAVGIAASLVIVAAAVFLLLWRRRHAVGAL